MRAARASDETARRDACGAPRQHLHQRAPQRKHVRPHIDRLAPQHLRRQVARRADHRDRGLGHPVRHAEVGHVGEVAVQQHVGGLDVAMQNAARVCGLQRARDLHDQRDRSARSNGPRATTSAKDGPSISRMAMYGTPSTEPKS